MALLNNTQWIKYFWFNIFNTRIYYVSRKPPFIHFVWWETRTVFVFDDAETTFAIQYISYIQQCLTLCIAERLRSTVIEIEQRPTLSQRDVSFNIRLMVRILAAGQVSTTLSPATSGDKSYISEILLKCDQISGKYFKIKQFTLV